jgi:hypothetical protein
MNENFNASKQARESQPVVPENQVFYDEKSKIIFEWKNYSKSYEPIAHSGGIDAEGNVFADPIEKDDIYYHFITYIRFASAIIRNKATGDIEVGKLEIYQWHIAFSVIEAVVDQDSVDVMCAISRQAKFSGLYKLL